MQKYANLVELEKCCQTHIFLQNFVLIQPRTSPPKICKNCTICQLGVRRNVGRPARGRRSSSSWRWTRRRPPRSRTWGWPRSPPASRRCPGRSAKLAKLIKIGKIGKIGKFVFFVAHFWRARSRLYQNEVLQENMRLTAFFKLYKMCTLCTAAISKF